MILIDVLGAAASCRAKGMNAAKRNVTYVAPANASPARK
jgi:hypothetical protein